MANIIQVFFMPVSEPVAVEHLRTYADALTLLPPFSEWERSPDKYGLGTFASRNGWHQSSLHQICKGLGIKGLEFLVSKYFVCLKPEDLQVVASALNNVVSAIANGIPNLGTYESADIEWLRLPGNADSFERAAPAFHVRYDDSAESFYSFIMSLGRTVDEARKQNKCLLYMCPWA